MNYLNISKKIWLGISVLILGLVIFVVAAFFGGKTIENKINEVKTVFLPSAELSNQAKLSFGVLIDNFGKAFLESEVDLLDEAKESSNKCDLILQNIIQLDKDPKRLARIKAIRVKLKKYTDYGLIVYKEAIDLDGADMSVDLSKCIEKESKSQVLIANEIEQLNNGYAKLLGQNLSEIQSLSKKTASYSLILGASILIISLIVVRLLCVNGL